MTPEYLRTKHGDAGEVLDLRNTSLSLGRRFRSLKLWFVLRSYGIDGFQSHIRNGVRLASELAEVVRVDKQWELVARPVLSLVVFRLRPEGVEDGEELNRVNRLLFDRISARKDILLTVSVTFFFLKHYLVF